MKIAGWADARTTASLTGDERFDTTTAFGRNKAATVIVDSVTYTGSRRGGWGGSGVVRKADGSEGRQRVNYLYFRDEEVPMAVRRALLDRYVEVLADAHGEALTRAARDPSTGWV